MALFHLPGIVSIQSCVAAICSAVVQEYKPVSLSRVPVKGALRID
jgi:hypothetical protein